jgi:hypothetical protein
VPRYFFHLHNDIDALDEEGLDLADLEAARAKARDSVQFAAAESIRDKAHLVLDHRIDIADDSGAILETVRFGDVVTVESS